MCVWVMCGFETAVSFSYLFLSTTMVVFGCDGSFVCLCDVTYDRTWEEVEREMEPVIFGQMERWVGIHQDLQKEILEFQTRGKTILQQSRYVVAGVSFSLSLTVTVWPCMCDTRRRRCGGW